MSQLVFKSLREPPSEAEAKSHKLLLRGAYIRRLASGVYSYLPLGMKVLSKVSQIVREEFDRTGAQEILLPALHPIEIWEATGRAAKMVDVLMHVETKGGSFVLGPTHEEAVIEAVKQDLSSYRDLPATVYQIQTKFRDEPRSRFGLMRTREFIMADGYSFDVDQEGMRASYKKIYEAYNRIFSRIGVPFEPVEADSGAIGGDVNHEFMSPADIGEDHYAKCLSCDYRANIEAAKRQVAIASEARDFKGLPEITFHYTPEAPGVEVAVRAISALGVPLTEADMLKCLVAKDETGSLFMLLVPGDREVRVPSGLSMLTDEEFKEFPFLYKGFIGPMGAQDNGVKVIADFSVAAKRVFATGGNKDGYHVSGAVLDRDFIVDEFRSLVAVRDGDSCPNCGGRLTLVRAVEIGHTFQLGLTYSNLLSQASFTGSDGELYPYFMGCYGIGVTRLIAVIAEHFSDERGLCWPTSVAPYEVVVVPLGAGRSLEVERTAQSIYDQLLDVGIETLIDDRRLSAGVSLADCELIGVPYEIIVGTKSLAEGSVEVKLRRDDSVTKVQVGDVVSFMTEQLRGSK